MKAIAKTGPQRGVELIEVPEPRVEPGEVLVEVKTCGICGSDLHFYLSELGAERRISAFPRVLGHEPGETAKTFTYWFVTQEDGDQSVIGWGTYDWAFRLEGGLWKVTELIIHVLAMTTLEKGWAIPDKVMMPFQREK